MRHTWRVKLAAAAVAAGVLALPPPSFRAPGYPLSLARQTTSPSGGRRILMGTDRLISFLELRDQPRTVDYPFMVIDIRLDASGKGEGKLMPLAKITEDRDHIVEIENYASEPVRLTSVQSTNK